MSKVLADVQFVDIVEWWAEYNLGVEHTVNMVHVDNMSFVNLQEVFRIGLNVVCVGAMPKRISRTVLRPTICKGGF